jgi:hypothetical protein
MSPLPTDGAGAGGGLVWMSRSRLDWQVASSAVQIAGLSRSASQATFSFSASVFSLVSVVRTSSDTRASSSPPQ